MTRSSINRRALLSVSSIGIAASALGARFVLAQDDSPSTPGATPGASPAASPAAAATEVTVEMVDIDFDPNEFTIPADTDVTVICPNLGNLEHNFIIEDTEYGTEIAEPGETVSVTVNLPAGEYVYYCSVPGHREAGMVGTLTVE